MKRKGMTLVEVLVVLGIFIMIMNWETSSAKSILSIGSYNADKTLVSTVASSVSRFKYETGVYPAKLIDLTNKYNNLGPWLTTSNLTDSHNKSLNYIYNENNRFFKVWANGANMINNTGSASNELISGDDIGIVIRQ